MPIRSASFPASLILGLIVGGGIGLTTGGCSNQGTDGWQSAANGQLDERFVERRGQIQFVNDVETGCELAKRIGKPCLLFFTAEWCTYCQKMSLTTFADSQVGQLSQEFVCVLVDADREQHLCRHFSISGFPTIQFLSPDHRQLDRLVGWQTPQNLVAGMQLALQRTAWLKSSRTQLR